ncbi:MAG: cytochrome c [Pseudomonadota bacterium]
MRYLTLAAAALAPALVSAQDLPGDASAGLLLARDFCSDCHYVERQWADLYVYEAPSFVDIAKISDHSEMSLQVFFRSPHNRMPDIKLTNEEIDNVISYILGLRQER